MTGKVNTEYSLTAVDDKSREEMINTVVGLSALGGTCLHLGLEEGMRALESGGVKEGGVIIFLTDGQQHCFVRQPLKDNKYLTYINLQYTIHYTIIYNLN